MNSRLPFEKHMVCERLDSVAVPQKNQDATRPNAQGFFERAVLSGVLQGTAGTVWEVQDGVQKFLASDRSVDLTDANTELRRNRPVRRPLRPHSDYAPNVHSDARPA